MRPIVLAVTGVANSSVAPMNINTSPFNVGFGVTVSGTINYTVQHTFDNVWSSTFDPSTATWFDHPTIASQTTNKDGNYAFPVSAIRVIGNSGGGTATLTLLQAGIQ
jgi:hypothetical protein